MSETRGASGAFARLRESQSWRDGPWRATLMRLPPPVRALLRRLAKAAYWAVTPHRTFERIAYLRQRRALALAYRHGVLPSGAPAEDLGKAKAAFRAARMEELTLFLAGDERLALPAAEAPAVSIVLILYNQAELTYHCLRSLQALTLPAEVVILDNGSSDRTGELLDRLDGAKVVRSPENLHFLRGVNRAAKAARGEALLLLNNDTWVEPGSVEAAWARLRSEPDVGAVGGKIVLPNGTLQEAGSIVWRDGSCLGYGRGRNPDDPEFSFRRDVDYCSGAFLMVRRGLFEALGGLDEAFAPAYYEETDLCMRLRASGARVVYEPQVRLTHFEFGSAGSEAATALQERNRGLFVQRHAEALAASHHPPGTRPIFARMRERKRGRILIVDDRLPDRSWGSGLGRAADLLRAVETAGWFVTYYPIRGPLVPKAGPADDGEVEVLEGRGAEGLPATLAERADYYDAVLVSRPHNMEVFRQALGVVPAFARTGGLIYDAEAIFSRRAAIRRAVFGWPPNPALDASELEAELALIQGAEAIVSVSEAEAATFRTAAKGEVRVLGHAIAAQPAEAGFEARGDLLFVGALYEEGSPNTDSLVWFVRQVMPRLDALVGEDWALTIAGRCSASSVLALAGPRVRLAGRVDDLGPLYASARALIAPTRFAAGIPMKVHEAAGAGLPAVATELIAGQLGWRHGQEIMASSTPEGFAEGCRALLTEAGTWARVRDGAVAAVRRDCDPAAFERTVVELLAGFEGRRGRPAG